MNAGAAHQALPGPGPQLTAALRGRKAARTLPITRRTRLLVQHTLAASLVLSQAPAEMPPGAGHITVTGVTAVLLVLLTQAQEMSDLQAVPLGGQTREQQAQHVEDGQSQEPWLGPVCLLQDKHQNHHLVVRSS